ncbi:hypothetical protein Q604_UNBC04542G0001, partial [human gut metagenome]
MQRRREDMPLMPLKNHIICTAIK